MKNDKGFTLVELMVVIAIIGVLGSMSYLSISMAFSAGARQSAVETSALLSRCKVGAMSRGDDTYMMLKVDGNGYLRGTYVEKGSIVSDEQLGKRAVAVRYRIDGAGETELTAGSGLYLSFKRADGGLKTFGSSLSAVVDETAEAEISIAAGSKTYTIRLDALTGNHALED